MFDLGFLIFTGFVAALVGLLVGISLQRSVGGNASKGRELNKALDEAKEHNQTYQSHVAEHFSQTAVMLNDLTEKYKDIHHHLAAGADQLCRDDQGHSLLSYNEDAATGAAAGASAEPLQPPLDYAPKTDTASVGTLAEDYGLEKVDLNQQQTAAGTNAEPNTVAEAGSEANKAAPPNVRAV